MPPAGPKSDINRSGSEVTDFPAVCNDCLSATDNPFIQMIKEDHGMECKICTRPFTVFRWAADRTSRFKKTNVRTKPPPPPLPPPASLYGGGGSD